MTSRKASASRPLWLSRAPFAALVALGLAGIHQACRTTPAASTSGLTDSATNNARIQTVIRAFQRLIGRNPSASEIDALKTLEYPQLVKKILASQQFETEGFFNFHRERLLLNREGSRQFMDNSYDDYCSLRLELTEEAEEDRTGSTGYWDILRYRDRWLPVGDMGLNDCFFGTTAEEILAANAAQPQDGSGLDPDQPGITIPQKQARRCLQRIQFGFPIEGDADQAQQVAAFWQKVEQLTPEQKRQSLLYTDFGQQTFLTGVRQNLFPEWTQLPATATQPKQMKLAFVKKGGKPIFVQELGSQGNKNCVVKALDPKDWIRKDPPPMPAEGDGGNNGGVAPVTPVAVTPVGTTPNTPPAATPPAPPLTLPEPVGTPVQPVVMAAPAAAAEPAMQQAMAAADGTVFIKVSFPKEYVGVHANPYYLSRHPSKKKNRHLHRARQLYFAYFCTEINPDAANFQGDPITQFPEPLRPYFAPDDDHVKGSANCYNCHTKVQPLANFFGLSSFGTAYDADNGPVFDPFEGRRWPAYLPDDFNEDGTTGSDRPGGIYDGSAFFPDGGNSKGFEGLANVMSKYPAAKQCIVDSAWATLVGRDFPLFPDERTRALAAFEGPDGKASLAKLITSLMTDTQRGQVYFQQGEVPFAQIHPTNVFTCPDVVPETMKQSALQTLGTKCRTCHADEFINNNQFDFNNYFAQGLDTDSPQTRGRLWQDLYCKTFLAKMPPGGGGGIPQDKRDDMWCFLQRERDKAATAGTIPIEFKTKACIAAPAPAASAEPHAVTGTPPGGGQ